MPITNNLDLEVEAEEGAGFLPGLGVIPAEHGAITDAQVREFCWCHCIESVDGG